MNDVFVNRTLNLKKIKYIGFDMDHTLVRYDSRRFESLSHRVALEKLVQRGYPKAILDLPFEYDRVIRGLVIDRQHGNILKLSVRGAVRISFHGTRPIDYATQKKLYTGTLIDLDQANFAAVDTAFSIAYAGLFAQLVDLKDGSLGERLPSYEKLSLDILECIDEGHRDGSLKDVVAQQLDRFIRVEPELPAALERYLKHGKKLFLLTNSEYAYTKLLLDHAITPHLKEHAHWSELFEYVITLASKPRFFYDRLSFLRIEPKTGLMTNHRGPLTPGIYQGGCAEVFTRDLALSGEDILYFGDHIYGDILRLKKDCAWRTALVVEELDEEIRKNEEARPIRERIFESMIRKQVLEREFTALEDCQIEGRPFDRTRLDSLWQEISTIDGEIGQLIQKHQTVFNAHWGEVMRIGNEESFFAGQVERYACVYAATLNQLLSCSPRAYFRAYRKRLPHEAT